MDDFFDITLAKLKYRNPQKKRRAWLQGEPAGLVTWVVAGKSFTAKTSNSGKSQHAKQGTGHRRRQGWGSVIWGG